MSLTLVGSLPLGGVNLTAAASASILGPLLGQFDAAIFGELGLGGLEADIAAQLNASLQAQLQIGVSINNPIDSIQAALAAMASVQASLQASLALGLPDIHLTAALSASAAVSATLAAKLGGLQAMIAAALALKAPAVDFLANLNLSAGPIVVGSWGFATAPTSLAQTGFDISTSFSTGFGGLLPSDVVYGVLLVTKQPSASVALAASIRCT